MNGEPFGQTSPNAPANAPTNARGTPLNGNLKRASALLKAMGNRHRLLVLCRLLEGENSVGELEKIIGLSQSALSQHLARLRREGLVKTRRQAQTIFYSLSGVAAARIIGALAAIYADAGAPAPGEDDPDDGENPGRTALG